MHHAATLQGSRLRANCICGVMSMRDTSQAHPFLESSKVSHQDMATTLHVWCMMQLQAFPYPGRPLLGSWKSSFIGLLCATASMRPPISTGLRAKDCAGEPALAWMSSSAEVFCLLFLMLTAGQMGAHVGTCTGLAAGMCMHMRALNNSDRDSFQGKVLTCFLSHT